VESLADCPEFARLLATWFCEEWARLSPGDSLGKVELDQGEVLIATKPLPEGSAASEGRDRRPFQARKPADTWAPGKSIAHAAVVHGETTTAIGSPVQMIGAVVNPFGRRCFAGATSSFGAGPQDLPGCGIDYLVSPSTR
jgi:hypothetical protein